MFLRLEYLHRPPFGEEEIGRASKEWDQIVRDDTPISEMYALLTDEQKAAFAELTRNPSVHYIVDGVNVLNVGNLHLLRRLQAGERVGSVKETQVKRAPGTQAIKPSE
ncbi:hypothetical protein [Novosphingobium sp. M1R2S20]|uniref:Uncharacterized protein n=1 Tax=Novosphingobium rhizovicinum TaxID=3228928 RepID=A0ABV3R723_9SPHN